MWGLAACLCISMLSAVALATTRACTTLTGVRVWQSASTLWLGSPDACLTGMWVFIGRKPSTVVLFKNLHRAGSEGAGRCADARPASVMRGDQKIPKTENSSIHSINQSSNSSNCQSFSYGLFHSSKQTPATASSISEGTTSCGCNNTPFVISGGLGGMTCYIYIYIYIIYY